MKKLFLCVVGIEILAACTNALWYGEEGRKLDEVYAKYKGKELYCLGYCLLGDGYTEYMINYDKEYIEFKNHSYDGKPCMAYDAKTEIKLAKRQNVDAPCWTATYDTFLKKRLASGGHHPHIVDGSQGYVVYDNTYNTEGVLNVRVPRLPNYIYDTLRSGNEYSTYNGYIKISDIGTGKFGSWGTKEEADAFNHQMENEHQKDQKEKEDETRKKQQALKDMEKQYGYPWCNPRYLFFTQNKCMDNVNGAFFQVLQQTPDGTLVSFIKSPDYVLLISKNSKDDSVADGYSIYNGIFAVDGTYQYTSIFGATRTVKRLKRLK